MAIDKSNISKLYTGDDMTPENLACIINKIDDELEKIHTKIDHKINSSVKDIKVWVTTGVGGFLIGSGILTYILKYILKDN
ncbi:MAG: hypothetical protein K2Y14_12910 [Burkholderiales bacterium]|nr:hypothetical protein [Burkholderiales bacterium]